MISVVAELVAKAADVDVDRPVEHVSLVRAVDRVEELVAAQDAAVRLEERDEKPELDPGKRDGHTVAGHFEAVAIDDEVGVAEEGERGGGTGRRSAPKERLDAQDEFGWHGSGR